MSDDIRIIKVTPTSDIVKHPARYSAGNEWSFDVEYLLEDERGRGEHAEEVVQLLERRTGTCVRASVDELEPAAACDAACAACAATAKALVISCDCPRSYKASARLGC
jgi:hypothetical protein